MTSCGTVRCSERSNVASSRDAKRSPAASPGRRGTRRGSRSTGVGVAPRTYDLAGVPQRASARRRLFHAAARALWQTRQVRVFLVAMVIVFSGVISWPHLQCVQDVDQRRVFSCCVTGSRWAGFTHARTRPAGQQWTATLGNGTDTLTHLGSSQQESGTAPGC